VRERQCFDWRKLRLLRTSDQRVRYARNALATRIREAMARVPASPPDAVALSQDEKAKREAAVESGDKADVAKRILHVDLQRARSVLQRELLDAEAWPPGRVTRWRETWEAYRELLVTPLGTDYSELSIAFDFAGRLQDGLLSGPRPFIPSDRPFFHEAHDAIERGIMVTAT
jgi:hypothetical protein